jgi:hypothetical protein
MPDHADRLLAQTRAGAAELQRLERRRRVIAELQWQRARFISHHPTTTSTEGVFP